MYTKHGEAWSIFADNESGEASEERFQECYGGHHDSVGDYAEQLLEELGELPKGLLRSYIDFERYGRDLELGGEIWSERAATGGGVHVFTNC